MILVAFTKDIKKHGGLGDRIVGLISCKMIADAINQEFYILWDRENIREYVNYDKYDFKNQSVDTNDIKIYKALTKNISFKTMLINDKSLFTNDINKFYINQEISHYLYANPIYAHKDFYSDILNVYRNLFTDILKPTEKILNIVDNLFGDINDVTGIQIRTGDKYIMKCSNKINKGFNNPNARIHGILNKIKNKIGDKHIFITSDHPDIYNIAATIWNKDKIIYYDQVNQHMDYVKTYKDFSKTFVDCYALSQKTTQMYITYNSNYGRIAALSSNHNNIYNLDCIKMDKKGMISKSAITMN